jgi:hypothetical protein
MASFDSSKPFLRYSAGEAFASSGQGWQSFPGRDAAPPAEDLPGLAALRLEAGRRKLGAHPAAPPVEPSPAVERCVLCGQEMPPGPARIGRPRSLCTRCAKG